MRIKMNEIFDKFAGLKVLVIGDVMLDRYYFTDVNRISPEAPIPVAKFSSKKDVLGGAANVALNVSKLGCETFLVGCIGDDDNGTAFRELVDDESIKFTPVVCDMKTITKIRVVSSGSQLLRLDFEDDFDKLKSSVDDILEGIESLVAKVDLVIVSDYRKGMISSSVINYLKGLDKYVAIDTKPGVFTDFNGFNLIKPNFNEAVGIAEKLGVGRGFENIDSDVEELGLFLREKLGANILITRSSKGASFICEDGVFHERVENSEVIDVTGAGDTSISVFSLLDFLGVDRGKSLKVLNAAAKVTVSHLGSYSPDVFEIKQNLQVQELENILEGDSLDFVLSRLRKEGKRIVFTTGCFDILHKGHISYLNKAASFGDVLIVGVNSDDSVRRLKGKGRPIVDEYSRAFVLSNLKGVDYVVIFDEDTPVELIEEVRPDIHVKCGDYKIEDLPEAKIVEKYGGKIELIDFEDGFSTSDIIDKVSKLN